METLVLIVSTVHDEDGEIRTYVLTRKLMTVENAEKYRSTFSDSANISFVYPVRGWELRTD